MALKAALRAFWWPGLAVRLLVADAQQNPQALTGFKGGWGLAPAAGRRGRLGRDSISASTGAACGPVALAISKSETTPKSGFFQKARRSTFVAPWREAARVAALRGS